MPGRPSSLATPPPIRRPPAATAARRTSSCEPSGLVRDRGAGIRPQDLGQIFEPYFTTRRTGTGLGLPIARNIIEGLGGTLGIRTATDGTTIDIELPEQALGASAS